MRKQLSSPLMGRNKIHGFRVFFGLMRWLIFRRHNTEIYRWKRNAGERKGGTGVGI